MQADRFREIVRMAREWSQTIPTMLYKDALFALYDDRMITGAELDVMMHDCDIEVRMIRIREQLAKQI